MKTREWFWGNGLKQKLAGGLALAAFLFGVANYAHAWQWIDPVYWHRYPTCITKVCWAEIYENPETGGLDLRWPECFLGSISGDRVRACRWG